MESGFSGILTAHAVQDRINITTITDRPVYQDLADDVASGLSREQKSLPAKYFYDERGSDLFDRICLTPEYYPTRTEDELLSCCAADILECIHPHSIVELGSGASRKTRHFFDACERRNIKPTYRPVDICGQMLLHAGSRLCGLYPWLEIDAMVLDYTADLQHLEDRNERRLFAFLGGTLGNFTETEACTFLSEVRNIMRHDDRLLVGVDRVKDHGILNAAYNDAEGLTAEFNLNMLRVLNRELGAGFNPDQFEHRAWFNESDAQIEMHLRAIRAQKVRMRDLPNRFCFEQDETILTEISRKFTRNSFEQLLAAAGLDTEAHFEPDNSYFSLFLVRPTSGRI
ncbi:MAG: L-histidine N(alpha)-methyltransferase [Gammaproteobacteria bacterium]|nr:L-histidine N(alpha)-methyltransferase [Gammaproteobacteria bacterium]